MNFFTSFQFVPFYEFVCRSFVNDVGMSFFFSLSLFLVDEFVVKCTIRM